MPDQMIELLDRQYRFLSKLEGAEFLRELPRFLDSLDEDARLAALLADQMRDAQKLLHAETFNDAALIPALCDIRRRLVEALPEVDDSARVPPEAGDLAATLDFDKSLAKFDRIVNGEAHERGTILHPTGKEDHSRSEALLVILRIKHSQLLHAHGLVNLRRDDPRYASLIEISRGLQNAGERRRYAHQGFLLAREALPGVAQHRIRQLVQALNPEPKIVSTDEEFAESMRLAIDELRWGVPEVVRKALYGILDPQSEASLPAIIDRYSRAAERVYEDLRRRLGLTRAALALVHRFKTRCEWYDRERLISLLEVRRRLEDTLVDELARWMFDQGLYPLTRARVGGLEPDVLAPTRARPVYVEAKRYNAARDAKRTICRGFAQMCDTVGRLRGTPYEVREAFFAVFRLGGPRYLLPSVVHADSCKFYSLLIDIGDPAQTGSRQRAQPIEVTEADLLKHQSGE